MTAEDEYDRYARIPEAAAWLLAQSPTPLPILLALRERFGFNHAEAVEAVTHATLKGARST